MACGFISKQVPGDITFCGTYSIFGKCKILASVLQHIYTSSGRVGG